MSIERMSKAAPDPVRAAEILGIVPNDDGTVPISHIEGTGGGGHHEVTVTMKHVLDDATFSELGVAMGWWSDDRRMVGSGTHD